MTYNENFKILSFEKIKLITTKLLCTQKYNLIIISSSAKEHKTQIYNKKREVTKVNWHFPISLHNLLLTYLPPLLPLVPNFIFLCTLYS
jgi:hypothetical protein